jgi:cell wall-associated NlpC family hydrolase
MSPSRLFGFTKSRHDTGSEWSRKQRSLSLAAMQISLSSRSLRLVVRPILGCALVAACAIPMEAQAPAVRMGAAVQRRPFALWSESAHNLRDSLVTVARAQLGTRYVLGGTTPKGFDCSGLVRYVMGSLKVELPRTAAQQARIGDEVSTDPSRLRPGDLLTFGRRGRSGVSHIGIYVGQGRYIHASSVAGRVIESDLNRTGSPLIKAWRGVRRIVAGAEPDTAVVRSGG